MGVLRREWGKDGEAFLREEGWCGFGEGTALRERSLFTFLLPLVLDRVADLARMIAGEGRAHSLLHSHLGGTVVDHGEPRNGLAEEQVAIHHHEGGEEAEELCRAVHGP